MNSFWNGLKARHRPLNKWAKSVRLRSKASKDATGVSLEIPWTDCVFFPLLASSFFLNSFIFYLPSFCAVNLFRQLCNSFLTFKSVTLVYFRYRPRMIHPSSASHTQWPLAVGGMTWHYELIYEIRMAWDGHYRNQWPWTGLGGAGSSRQTLAWLFKCIQSQMGERGWVKEPKWTHLKCII